MTALPSNLALVGDDLARATFIDARRSLRRRRLTTCAVAFALFALTASAAVANGWLFGDATPVLRAVPSLSATSPRSPLASGGAATAASDITQSEEAHRSMTPGSVPAPPLGSANGADARTLLTGLGPEDRSLTVVTTTSGGACVALTGVPAQCIATFATDQEIAYFTSSPSKTDTVVWGLLRDDVTAVEVIDTEGVAHPAVVGNGGFYADVGSRAATRLIVHLADGGSDSVTVFSCPLTTPDCTP
jgi:hypothetical protein